MPRYFFHIIDGRAAVDNAGIEFENETEARLEAIRGAGEMLIDHGMNLWLGDEWLMAVTDENTHILFKLRFSVEVPRRTPTLVPV